MCLSADSKFYIRSNNQEQKKLDNHFLGLWGLNERFNGRLLVLQIFWLYLIKSKFTIIEDTLSCSRSLSSKYTTVLQYIDSNKCYHSDSSPYLNIVMQHTYY